MKRLMCALLLAAIMCTLASCAATREPKTGSYVLSSGEAPFRPVVTLESGGVFQFFFSPVSSYIAIGSYEAADGRVTLTTWDGDFVYEFQLRGGALVFDAKTSSGLTWGANLNDGDVFRFVENAPEESARQ